MMASPIASAVNPVLDKQATPISKTGGCATPGRSLEEQWRLRHIILIRASPPRMHRESAVAPVSSSKRTNPGSPRLEHGKILYTIYEEQGEGMSVNDDRC
jgi:hypothetical protein